MRPFVIGHVNLRILLVSFEFDVQNGLIIIEEINYTRSDEIEEKHCRPTIGKIDYNRTLTGRNADEVARESWNAAKIRFQ